jgi:hypothetical protein
MLKDILTIVWKRPDYEQDKEFSTEFQWYKKDWKPKGGVDYSSTLSYAKEQYSESLSVFDSLDRKAEWCFGLSVTISGAVVAFGDKVGLNVQMLFPSVAFLVLSMWGCLRCRLPGPRATPFDVRSLIDVTENTKAEEARMAASLHCAIRGIRIVTSWKSQLLGHSAILVVFSILWFGCVYSFVSR